MKAKKEISIFDPIIWVFNLWKVDYKWVYDLPELIYSLVVLHYDLKILEASLDDRTRRFDEFEQKIKQLKAIPETASDAEFTRQVNRLFPP